MEIIVLAVLAASVVTLMVSFYLGYRIRTLRRLTELVSSTPQLTAGDGASSSAVAERVAVAAAAPRDRPVRRRLLPGECLDRPDQSSPSLPMLPYPVVS
ncbi:hypothetical protein EDC02_5851 [Micromonospora sp. Llam0]|uniref:hypothetical protein n=1 Tax=Micromonospora sp. Llam0 TaxID=2485143 RepID=UPI000F4A6AF1|nr:hypothetical protein [Micromonospora sp. Llam0]ROO50988.1 hypothetical protein EDC02_5851 [Micromonospora sp. Llam0]